MTKPEDYFKLFESHIYTQFDENGIPTHKRNEKPKKDEGPGILFKLTPTEKELSKEIR